MIKHRRGILYAAATAEMHHHAVPAFFNDRAHQFNGVMAAAAALQSVKQNHQRRIGIGGIDKITGN